MSEQDWAMTEAQRIADEGLGDSVYDVAEALRAAEARGAIWVLWAAGIKATPEDIDHAIQVLRAAARVAQEGT